MLELNQLKKAAADYALATGCDCFLLELDGIEHTECGICTRIHQESGRQLDCHMVHRYGAYQSERFGGKYIFFCPLGLTHWISPIRVAGSLQYALVGGPCLMVDHEEYVQEFNMENLIQFIQQIPFVQPKRVSALSDMLFAVAGWFSDEDVEPNEALFKTLEGKTRTTYPLETEKMLLDHIRKGETTEAKALLNELLGYILFDAGGELETVRLRSMELVVLLSRACLEGGAEPEMVFGLNYRFLKEVHALSDLTQLTLWLHKILTRFSDCVFNMKDVKHVDVLYKAMAYIRQNYMNKLTLEDVSSQVYLSPSYFCKIFKSETGYSFNAYINKVRIETAKKLLLRQEINIVDVAFMVGFEDQSYFSKVFKKVTETTPKKYRESRGQY